MQIGIIVNNLEPSQLLYEVVNELKELSQYHSACLFYQNLTPCFYPTNFAHVNYNKIHNSYLDENSVIVATNTQAALDLSKAKNKALKLFYAYELEFLDNKDFDKNYAAYNSLPVITRSESYKAALKNYANIDALVLPLKVHEILWKLTR